MCNAEFIPNRNFLLLPFELSGADKTVDWHTPADEQHFNNCVNVNHLNTCVNVNHLNTCVSVDRC